MGGELSAECERTGNRPALVAANSVLAITYFHLGEFGSCAQHAARGLENYEPEQHRALSLLTGHDHGVQCRTYVAVAQWISGHGEEAMRQMAEVQSMARSVDHPYSIGVALFSCAKLQQFRHEVPLAEQQAQNAIAFSQQHGLLLPKAASTIVHGWALALQGRHQEGIAQIQQGIEAFRHAGATIGLPWRLSLLAEAYLASGQAADALLVAEQALSSLNHSADRVAEAELHRLKGDALLMRHGMSKAIDAEVCYDKALSVASQQRARIWELRAAMCLVRLWLKQGKPKRKAAQLLAPLYASFTEDRDAKDLRDARQMLSGCLK
jgi:predicted ATPase